MRKALWMQAIIFNSGLGSRMRELTANGPKSMVKLSYGETIFERQLRVLQSCGIDSFVITTGPYPGQLMSAAAPFVELGCTFSFVPNPEYDKTNYIFSMHRARPYIKGETALVLHGDLVFDEAYARSVIESPLPSLGSVNASLPQPAKDFKARVADDFIQEVSVSLFDNDCVAFQPFYKLDFRALSVWLDRVDEFCERGETGVYAENAANEVFSSMRVAAFSYEGHVVEEVDTPEDLERVSKLICACEPSGRAS